MKQTIFFLIATISTVLFAEPVRSMLGADGSSKVQTDVHDLPDGIVAVEFLESTGTQWIDTDIPGNICSKIVIIASGSQYNAAWLGCGSSLTSSDRLVLQTYPTSGSPMRSCCRMDGTLNLSSVVCENKLVMVMDIQNQTITYGEITYSISFSGKISNMSIFLFGANIGDYELASLRSNGHRIYEIILYGYSQNIICHMIPVRVEDDYGKDLGAMYDLVSGELFLNQGTGDFIIGPDL